MNAKFDKARFGFDDLETKHICNLVEFKFIDSKNFEPQMLEKGKRSLHDSGRTSEGSFYVITFAVPSPESQKIVITIKDIKVNKSPTPIRTREHLPSPLKIEPKINKHTKNEEKPVEIRKQLLPIRVDSKSPNKIIPYFHKTQNLQTNKHRIDAGGSERVHSPRVGGEVRVDYRDVVDRLHPKTQKSKSREKTPTAKDYYIAHPDIYREVIFKLEGKPVSRRQAEGEMKIRVVAVDKNHKRRE